LTFPRAYQHKGVLGLVLESRQYVEPNFCMEGNQWVIS
jgi:hypothetical protein